jgi:hypothetical protein
MRRIATLALAIFALLGVGEARAADPNLVGTWTGGGLGVGKTEGWADDPVTLVITEQRGRAFTGRKTHSEGEEAFYGAIMVDGRTLLMTDDGDGETIGSLLPDGTLEICYMEAGDDAQVFCRVLKKAS